MAPMRCPITILAAILALAGCAEQGNGVIDGRPGGPYRLTLVMDPPTPKVGQETTLRFQLTNAQRGTPVEDLQIAHERLIHNFIVNLDFSSFAHIHHEDFYAVTERDLTAATLRFPYRFPSAGRYRIVSEFAHRNRSWTKHFDIEIGDTNVSPPVSIDTARTRHFGDYTASLRVSPEVPEAGFETELLLELARNGNPVTDLGLYLGSELHGAVWRDDGRFFGHLHSYTPKIAAILELAHERGGDPAARGARIQEMLVQLMCLPSALTFSGPEIPMRYVFPAPGRYHLFLQVAPGGGPTVFHFGLDVTANPQKTDVRGPPRIEQVSGTAL